jgi:cellulose synthase/poly-beta-1,6-N-acetylglucosamine synthase-like glycosyltransferase
MDQTDLLQLVFWLSLLALGYTFIGYPVVIALLSWTWPKPGLKRRLETPPSVSVVLAAGNEEERIVARLENLLASDYPRERLEIVVVSDGSTDRTAQMVSGFAERGVRLVRMGDRSGKAACLNAGVPLAKGEIVVLCDARQRFAPETIAELVANFDDGRVGAVSGELFIESAESGVGGGVDLYWKLEKFIRESEARFSSVIGATGAVYAIRRNLFEPLPVDTLLDDVVIPMRIALRGYRVGFDPSAPAYDPQTTDPVREKRRKLRTLAGNFQMLFRYPGWLAPWRTGLWWQVLSHKYSRVIAPVFMAAMLVSNALLVGISIYRWIFAAQCGFYLLALLGALLPGVKIRLLSIPSGFVFLNLMSVGGFWNYARGVYRHGRW